MVETVVILGAGYGGVQAAASLREEGFAGAIRLIEAGTALPYQRPPLSKAFMKGEATADGLVLRGEAFYREQAIDLALGVRAAAIEPGGRLVRLADGKAVAYDHLILATGARARPLPLAGVDLKGVHALRDLPDAERLKAEIAGATRAVVVGAGFIGLEFAAVAATLGLAVTVLEAAPRVMMRAVSEPMSRAFEAKHRALGVDLRLGEGVRALIGDLGRVTGVETASGSRLAADIVLLAVGVLAEDRLAAEAGLAVENGVAVDAALRASDPAIFAVGDNNCHPNDFFGGRLRLESVQNAVDQARAVARTIAGRSAPYRALPWFWSDQADWKLQIAGVSRGLTRHVLRGEPESGSFSVFGYEGERLAVVESVNRPADHMIARRLIDARVGPTPEQAADPAFDLRALARSVPSA
jgi:3-phenylpropionate/trans-cinnamate dioxygenase ferredoxin reductase subunit